MKELILKVIEILKTVLGLIDKTQALEVDGITAVSAPTKFKLAVIVGHEKKAQGAAMHRSQGFISEYMYNNAIADLMIDYGKTVGVEVVKVLRDGIGISGANKKAASLKPDACIELHFNAANGTAHGTEVLCTLDAQDKTFAALVQANVCKVFERTGMSRGVKPIARSARGGGNVHGLPGIANCLVEPFFGDNQKEAEMAMKKKSEYAKALVDAFVSWTKK